MDDWLKLCKVMKMAVLVYGRSYRICSLDKMASDWFLVYELWDCKVQDYTK